MELKECLEMIYTACTHYGFVTAGKLGTEREYEGSYEQACDIVLEELNNRIPRKDIEDLKQKIHWELDKNGITRGYQIIIDGYFNKLLNKE